jgi:hypothetical protein
VQANTTGPAAKKPSALSKHRAWLQELKKKQEELKDQELITELEKEERRLKVRPRFDKLLRTVAIVERFSVGSVCGESKGNS